MQTLQRTPRFALSLLVLTAVASARPSEAGAQAAAPASGAIHLPAERVKAAFARGEALQEQEDLKVHASRRTAPGEAEIHLRDTDVIYVLEGTASFVTGGRAVDARAVTPDELRGPRIEGGETRTLSPGDVVIVPRGVPHWFAGVSGPFVYYVVKVSGAPAASAPAASAR